MALARVSSCRCLAAAMIGAVLSGRIGCLLVAGTVAVFEAGDDVAEVGGDLPVHLGHPGLAASLGSGDDLQRLLVLLPVLGQELGSSDEHRAGQAPLTELTSIFQQFMAPFRSPTLTCPPDRIGSGPAP